MEKSSQIAWKLVPLRHFFPLKVVPLIEVLLYTFQDICGIPKVLDGEKPSFASFAICFKILINV
jgi:hypothetical protein